SADGLPVPGGLRPANELQAPATGLQAPANELQAPATGLQAPAASPLPPRPAAPSGEEAVLLEYLRGISQAVSASSDMVERYLGARAGQPPVAGAEPATAAPADAAAVVELVTDAPAGAWAVPGAGSAAVAETSAVGEVGPAPAVAPPSREELLASVVAVVSDRTGYPSDMLGADLDLEADLSIDSIKRVEIMGDLVARLGLGSGGAGALDDAVVEQLTVLKSLSQIVDWMVGRAGPPPGGPGAAVGAQPDGAPAAGGGPGPVRIGGGSGSGTGPGLERYVQRVEPAGRPTARRDALAGLRYFVSRDSAGVAAGLADLLEGHGAEVSVGDLAGDWSADGLVHLGSLRPGPAGPAEVFGQLLPHVAAGLRSLTVVTGTGGSFGRHGGPSPAGAPAVPAGAGLRGMAKALAHEYPGLRVRCVDVDPDGDPGAMAGQLVAEVMASDALVEVGYRAGQRLRLRTVPEPLVQDGRPGIEPGAGDVVMLTGGARGITAAVAVALAGRGCTLELVGRTPVPGPAGDGAGEGTAAASEIRATLAAVEAAGGSARYHALDVRDAPAVSALVDDIGCRHGRLDGIIHGAGVLEDRLASAKTVESFARVYDTKVEGARALLASSARCPTRFVVLFGSVAGAFGNRGQVDYAAANEALEAMAWANNGGPAGRVVCIHWGPWGGAGMVSPALERSFARRGVGLISPSEGVACLLRELALGSPSTACAVAMRAHPDQMRPAAPPARAADLVGVSPG
ncbi:MAG: SDR family NAD(P)-dependent oxidoreductase, partial [Acidimicrobiales bacterium]